MIERKNVDAVREPFLSAHTAPVLYELEPAAPDRAVDSCLKVLDSCQVYLLIVGTEYGARTGDISLTHAEYRRANERDFRSWPSSGADAYRGEGPDGEPRDHEDIRAPMPLAIDRALAFVEGEELTSRRCERDYGVTRDTANRDFKVLMELQLARRIGRGRSTRYVLVDAS